MSDLDHNPRPIDRIQAHQIVFSGKIDISKQFLDRLIDFITVPRSWQKEKGKIRSANISTSDIKYFCSKIGPVSSHGVFWGVLSYRRQGLSSTTCMPGGFYRSCALGSCLCQEYIFARIGQGGTCLSRGVHGTAQAPHGDSHHEVGEMGGDGPPMKLRGQREGVTLHPFSAKKWC